MVTLTASADKERGRESWLGVGGCHDTALYFGRWPYAEMYMDSWANTCHVLQRGFICQPNHRRRFWVQRTQPKSPLLSAWWDIWCRSVIFGCKTSVLFGRPRESPGGRIRVITYALFLDWLPRRKRSLVSSPNCPLEETKFRSPCGAPKKY